jgi:hypothetical protein
VHPDHIAQLGSNYTYEVQADYINPEKDIDIADEEERVSVQDEILISEEDDVLLGEAFARLERNELKSELIALEEEHTISESELNEPESPQLEPVSNNNQIETNDTNDFEWF